MTHASFESESDRAERVQATAARAREIMAGNPDCEAATLAVRDVVRCGNDPIFPASDREFAGHCRSGNMQSAYAWGVCTCEQAARAALAYAPPTPAESRALAADDADAIARDDAMRSRL